MFEKPTIEQTAWVIRHLCDHLKEGGSFRYLIYERMGYPPEAYVPLFEAGGMVLSNAFCELQELEEKIKELSIEELARIQGVEPISDVSALCNTWPGSVDNQFEESI